MIASPLIILLLVPLAAIVFILLKAPAQQTAAVAAGLNLVLSLGLLFNYPYQDVHGGYAYVMNDPWVPLLNGMPPIRFHFGVDGISLPLVFLTAIVTFAAIAISPGNIRRANEYYCYLLIMSLGAMGAFISLDLFFFYIFHEFALIPTFLLIGIWGAQNRQFASFQVTIYLMAGSLILLAGLVALVMAMPSTARTFDLVALQGYINDHPIGTSSQAAIFPLLLVGFGILVGLFPFHSWAPPGYASAPPAAAMLHAGILKKFAIYGMIRIAIPLLHDGFDAWRPVILTLLAGNFLYAGFITIAQKELPTMIGFSSIMHMGYLFLGVVCWNVIGVTGAVILMVAHGLSAALMFGLSGEITHRAGENRFSSSAAWPSARRYSPCFSASPPWPRWACRAWPISPGKCWSSSARSRRPFGSSPRWRFTARSSPPFSSSARSRTSSTARCPRAINRGARPPPPSRSGRAMNRGAERRHERRFAPDRERALRPAYSRLAGHRLHALPAHSSRRAERVPPALHPLMLSVAYLSYFAPAIVISLWAMGLLLLEAFLNLSPRAVATLALIGTVIAAVLTVLYADTTTLFWGGMCRWDGAARFFNLFFPHRPRAGDLDGDEVQAPVSHDGGEFVTLPLFTTAGLMMLASANDFIMLFIALELVTISFYILVAYQRRSLVALEAGVKYLILGGLSSSFSSWASPTSSA